MANSPNVTDLLTLIQMISVQACFHKLFGVNAAESEVEQSKCHQCVNYKKVNQTVQSDLRKVEQSENNRSSHADSGAQCSGRLIHKMFEFAEAESELEQSNCYK